MATHNGYPTNTGTPAVGDTIHYTIVHGMFDYIVGPHATDTRTAVVMSETNDRGRVVVEDVNGPAHVIDADAIIRVVG